MASLGYDTGPADGVLGPRTRAAIRAFEAREGLSVTGTISERLEAALRSASPAIAGKASPAVLPLKKVSTGSGFVVSRQGHILTNRHVVAICREVRMAGTGNAEQMANDEKVDLALLKVSSGGRTVATFRGGRGVRTGDDIIIVGYPLQGLLTSEMNATKGIVSALAGPGEDRSIMQITAPVQPGNSGGPVLDASGHVVGVVVARLDALKLARRTGRLPQNVNFAISEGAARAFLDAHDVPYKTARSNAAIEKAMAERSQRTEITQDQVLKELALIGFGLAPQQQIFVLAIKPLTNTRHERFAQLLFEGKTADNAYATAGYKPDRHHASRLATKGNIRARVAFLQSQVAERNEITQDFLVEKTKDILEHALTPVRTKDRYGIPPPMTTLLTGREP